jgi:hypothetical protein
MARRQNPIDFTVTPGARESIDLRTRTAASMYSPIKHRAIKEKLASSPHNFRVVLLPRLGAAMTIADVAALSRPDAITLTHMGQPPDTQSRGESVSESIYTAFTYMHRLGDVAVRPYEFIRGEHDGLNPLEEAHWDLTDVINDAKDAAISALRDMSPALAAQARRYDEREYGYSLGEIFAQIIASRVNSKMVREGYAASRTQADADLFALAELTPPSRPLLRPYTSVAEMAAKSSSPRFSYHSSDEAAFNIAEYGLATPRGMEILNAYMAQFDILWRKWHDLFIRANYGTAAVI